MLTLPFGSTGRTTTRLGFGGSCIMGSLNRRQSLALLETAYDAGIRHFDTAPMYGYGEAEGCLGEFLSRHQGELTVTTKFGIPPAQTKSLVSLARAVARPILQSLPGLKRVARRTLRASAAPPSAIVPAARTPNPIFKAAMARISLEESLTKLRVEHIDLWLLHEVTAVDLQQNAVADSLLRFMEDSVSAGKIGAFGVGSDRSAIPDLLAQHPAYCGVQQYQWSILDPLIPPSNSFRIHHRAISERYAELVQRIQSEQVLRDRWSAETGRDLAEPGMLAKLMLKASVVLNPGSIVLFSTKQKERVQANVAAIDDMTLDKPARTLYTLVQTQRPQRN